MADREEYMRSMRAALERMQVKASLAKLELRQLRDELAAQHDDVRDRLHRLGEATGERWQAAKAGFEAAWQAFVRRYEDVMAKHRAAE